MGPAYFPTVLGALLIVIGAIAVIRPSSSMAPRSARFAYQGACADPWISSLVRIYRSRSRPGRSCAFARYHQRLREHTLPLGTDDRVGRGSRDLLYSGFRDRAGRAITDPRALVGGRLIAKTASLMDLIANIQLGFPNCAHLQSICFTA